MTSGQKIAFSLLAALGLFAILVMSLNSRLFNELETRFYAQAKIEENTGQLDKISESCDSYISDILTLVEKGENAWVKNASVRSYYVQNPSESDVTQRRRVTESLFEQIPALSGIRIIDKNGKNVHYSSFDDTDLLKQAGLSKTYKNYSDITKDAGEIAFEQLSSIISETKSVLLCDENRNRLILCVPFCWVDGIYSGVALFYLNLHGIENELSDRELVPAGEAFTLFSDDKYDGGLIINLPRGTKNDFRLPVLNYWKARSESMSRSQDLRTQPEKLLAIPDGRYYVTLSSNRIGKIRVSAIYTSDVFELSTEIRVLIYICIFISILLLVFLIFSFFRDPLVTLKKRVKKLQLEIIEDYIDGKEKRSWSDIARHLRQRKNDLSDDIIAGLHIHSKKRRKEISDYLEKNWDEIFAIFAAEHAITGNAAVSNGAAATGAAELNSASMAEIRRMLEEVLQSRNLTAASGAVTPVQASASPVQKQDEVEELDDVEELAEDIDEVEEVEELAEEVDDAEKVEDLAEEVDEADEVEELAEEADDAEEVEELTEEADEADEVEELAEEVDEVDEVEELAEEADDAEEVEELDEAGEVEELSEDIDDAEEVEELAEEVDDAEEVEDLAEELDEADDANEENLEVLEEYEESVDSRNNAEMDAFLKSMIPPERKYIPSNDTYFASEKFADVENLFAEELKLGNFKPYTLDGSKTIEVKLYPVPQYSLPENEEAVEDVSEAETEEPVEEAEIAAPAEETVEETQVAEPADETVVAAPAEETVEETQVAEPADETVVAAPAEEAVEETEAAASTEEVVEELTEEIPSYLPEPDFSMTSFGDNLTDDIPELESENVIIEDNGVYSISEDLECTGVVQNQDFKKLVDSVLI